MKLLINMLIIVFLSSSILEAGVVSKIWVGGKKVYVYFIKKVPKHALKSYQKEVKSEIVRFSREKDELFKSIKIKQKKAKNKKKQARNRKSTISIASWNIHNASINSDKAKIDYLNQYIRNLYYIQFTDIVFLQEIRDSKGSDIFQNNILKTAGYLKFVSKPLGENNHKERYVTLIHVKLLAKLKKIGIKAPTPKPIQLRSYKQFKRPPQGVVLGKDLILLNVHLGHYGNSKESKKQRIAEARALRQQVRTLMTRYKTKHIIIAGDFNLNHMELQNVFKPINNMKFNISTVHNTTVKNNYDHIVTTLPISSDIVSWVASSINNDLQVSDHKPIRVTVKIKGEKLKKN